MTAVRPPTADRRPQVEQGALPAERQVNWREISVPAGFLLLLLLFFWPVVLGGRTLVPFDVLYTDPVWAVQAQARGITYPQNGLLADLILENYVWKQFIRQSLAARQLPLWNPHLFAGVPFLAAGQHSALYPLSIVFYILPLWRAYGVFTVLQLWLAGVCMYLYLRVLRVGRFGAALAGLTYMLGGVMVVNIVFPMFLGVLAWLPLLLALVEGVVRAQEATPAEGWLPRGRRLLALLALSGVVGLQFLAGHIEISAYALLITTLYGLWRLAGLLRHRGPRPTVQTLLWLATAGLVGTGLASVQLIPLYELVRLNFRQGAAGLQQVLQWAYPKRQVLAFLIPDVFGNPAHHRVFDLFTRRWVTLPGSTEWGIKNYVEGTAYLGLLPLLLALSAVVTRRGRSVGFFVVLAVVSLLLAFGTPLYALVYYGLPGFSQVHTPFRWVLGYALATSVLAGLGADGVGERRTRRHLVLHATGVGALTAGLAVLGGVGLAVAYPAPALRLAERVLQASQAAARAFGEARLFLSYELYNLALFGGLLALSGLTLALARWQRHVKGIPAWQFAAVGVLVLDLWAFGHDFYPRVDPGLLETPPVVRFLQQKVGARHSQVRGQELAPSSEGTLRMVESAVGNASPPLFRVASYGPEHVLWPNAAMLYGLSDVRGYDSIIPRQYTRYMARLGAQDLLAFNRIGPLVDPQALDSPLLDLLNVRYVVSVRSIEHPDFRLAYRDGDVRIYEHRDALPRALLVPEARVIEDPDRLLDELTRIDPRRVLLLDQPPSSEFGIRNSEIQAIRIPQSAIRNPRITRYTPTEIEITVETSHPAWLLLTDSYFPGWRAFVTPEGGAEQEVEIYRADGNFRAVAVPAGKSRVRFKYFPMSLKVGLYVSFLAAMVVFLGALYWVWGRLSRSIATEETARRVAKNSLVPMGASLLNKVIDFAFAMLMLRILGPTDAGKYYFAIVVVGFVEIFTNFGLNLLLVREVAKDRTQANRYLSNTALLRLILWGAALPLLGLFVLFRQLTQPLDGPTLVALGLLTLALVPANISAALSSLFTAYEEMEVPAAITTVTTLLKVSLGTLALLLGYGFVGLAGVAVAVNVVTALIFLRLVTRRFFRPRLEFDPAFVGGMVGVAAPLMLNHLLQTVFFKIDVVVLDQYWPEAVVGWYSTAYKWIDALLIIPAYFTMAIFPLMSRRAQDDRTGLMAAYRTALRLLLMVALPIAMATVFIADELVRVLGGAEYLPHGAIALRIMIWFLPLSFVNGVTQYVLIAIDQQRWITVSFTIATAFNLLANLLLIPRFGYPAAAAITILSEVVLFIPFYRSIRKHLGPLPLPSMSWRPAVAAGMLGATMAALRFLPDLVALLPAGLVYVAALLALGAFTEEDRELARRLLPERVSRRIGLAGAD